VNSVSKLEAFSFVPARWFWSSVSSTGQFSQLFSPPNPRLHQSSCPLKYVFPLQKKEFWVFFLENGISGSLVAIFPFTSSYFHPSLTFLFMEECFPQQQARALPLSISTLFGLLQRLWLYRKIYFHDLLVFIEIFYACWEIFYACWVVSCYLLKIYVVDFLYLNIKYS
jgi:hypothetical protein